MCGIFAALGTTLASDTLEMAAARLTHRGPDQSSSMRLSSSQSGAGLHFVFHRLAIVDQSERGQQPFTRDGLISICNGEIYNEPALRASLDGAYQFDSDSDCEIILPLYQRFGIDGLLERLDGEFAFVLYDGAQDRVYAARDPMGIRPLFYSHLPSGGVVFASEAKALVDLGGEVTPFPPGHFYVGEGTQHREQAQLRSYCLLSTTPALRRPRASQVSAEIRARLSEAVAKRLRSDAPVGFLLSGGLDSSLVCAIAARLSDQPITTFSVGIKEDPIDTHYAREVAAHIGSDHHEYLFSQEELRAHLSELIYHLETWDITTVRASMGMSLLCRYIRRETDIKVVLTGEVSDELFGYKYTDFAPSSEAFQREAEKRVQELYLYDVLRADRCISMHGLEARVPFSDERFVRYVMSLDPALKMNTTGVGKQLLRSAFEEGDYLPHSILYREKAAFSDAVGHSMVDHLKALAERRYDEAALLEGKRRYAHGAPFTKEALLYREIFESHFPGQGALIPDFWMPNKEWEGCDVDDPSARVLSNYGASGDAPATKDARRAAEEYAS